MVDLAPVSEVILDEAAITRFRQNYRIEFGAAGTDDPLYEAVSAGRKHQGMEHWLPFFHERLETLFDYLPDASVMLDDQVDARAPVALGGDRRTSTTRGARRWRPRGGWTRSTSPAAPGLLYLDDAAWEAAVAGHRVMQLSPLPQSPGPGVLDAGGRIGRSFAPERQLENVSLFGALADHIRSLARGAPGGHRQLVRRRARAAARADGGSGRAGRGRDPRLRATCRAARAGCTLPSGRWSRGSPRPGLAVISEQDVLGDRLISQAAQEAQGREFPVARSTR